MEAQQWQTYILMSKELINTAVEQGLWVTLMVDMMAITRRIKKGSFLYEQRKTMIEMIDTLTQKELAKGLFGAVKIPNPGYYLFRMFRPLLKEMKRSELDENGDTWYSNMDPVPSALLIFAFPGVLKLLAAQIGEIIPG